MLVLRSQAGVRHAGIHAHCAAASGKLFVVRSLDLIRLSPLLSMAEFIFQVASLLFYWPLLRLKI